MHWLMEVPVPPSANKLWRFGEWGRVHKSDEAESYEAALGTVAKTICPRREKGDWPGKVWVVIEVSFGRKLNNKCDLDNVAKIVIDALSRALGFNDYRVSRINMKKTWDDEAFCVVAIGDADDGEASAIRLG